MKNEFTLYDVMDKSGNFAGKNWVGIYGSGSWVCALHDSLEKEVFLYSPAFDVEYNEDDIMDCVGRELGVEVMTSK